MRTIQKWNTLIRAYFTNDGIYSLSSEESVRLHAEGILGSGIDTSDSTVPSGYRPAKNDAIRAHYDALASNQDRITAMFYDTEMAIITFLARRLSDLHPQHIIEAGCGAGSTLAFLASAFPRAAFTGYDIAPEMIRRAKQRINTRRLENISLTIAHHGAAPTCIPTDHADLLYTECSFDAGAFPVVDFDAEASDWKEFTLHDPTMTRWRETFAAFRALLHTDGWYIHIGNNCAGGIRMLVDVARRCGFRYFPKRSRVISDDTTVPSSLHPRTLERFGWEYGICESFNCALVFQRT